MIYFIAIIVSFLIGVAPNSYVINILNYDKSWKVKVVTISVDLLKGMSIVILNKYLFNFEFIGIVVSLLLCFISHSLFQGLKLKLRNGHFILLAGLSLFLPIIVILWGLIWLISFAYKRNRDFSLLASSILTGLVSITSSDVLNNAYWYSNPLAISNVEFSILVGLIFSTLFATQIYNFRTYYLK